MLEYTMRTGEGDWTTASLQSVTKTAHLLHEHGSLATTARVIDAGCGMGFLAAVLAILAPKAQVPFLIPTLAGQVPLALAGDLPRVRAVGS